MSSLRDMVAFLEKQIWFPEPRRYDRYLKEGLLAVGGDLSVRRLKLAYEKGIFGAPTFVSNNKIFWGQDRIEFVLKEASK